MQNSRLNTFEHQSLRILRFHSQANIIMVSFLTEVIHRLVNRKASKYESSFDSQ